MKKNYFNELSNFLFMIRKNRNFTMKQVSNETGISTGYLSDIENRLEERIGIPRKNTLMKLVNFYNLTKEEEEIYIRIVLNLSMTNFFSDKQIHYIKEKHHIEN